MSVGGSTRQGGGSADQEALPPLGHPQLLCGAEATQMAERVPSWTASTQWPPGKGSLCSGQADDSPPPY